MKNKISKFENIVKLYQKEFKEHGDSPKSVFWPKGRQDLRFSKLCQHINHNKFSVLDFGCGLGHLLPYLENKFKNVKYHGVDIVPQFIDLCRNKYSQHDFQLINSYMEIKKSVDYVLISGTFSLMNDEDEKSHLNIVLDTISHLFSLCNIALSVNFMSDNVDFKQKGAFHPNSIEFLNFVRNKISSRFIFDHSYMPYEYSIIIFKKENITKNISI